MYFSKLRGVASVYFRFLFKDFLQKSSYIQNPFVFVLLQGICHVITARLRGRMEECKMDFFFLFKTFKVHTTNCNNQILFSKENITEQHA